MRGVFAARPRSRARGRASPPPAPPPQPKRAPRITLIHLSGTDEPIEWLNAAHRKSHIARSMIGRLGLASWAERNGDPPFPMAFDDAAEERSRPRAAEDDARGY